MNKAFIADYFSTIHGKIQLWYSVFLFTLLAIVLYFSLKDLRKTAFEDIDRDLLSKVYVFSALVFANMEIEYAKAQQQKMQSGEVPYQTLHIITRWEIANGHKGRYINANSPVNEENYRPYSKIRQQEHIEDMLKKGEYFITYNPDRTIFDRSENAPLDAPVPALRNADEATSASWSRGSYREVLSHANYDFAVLIGADLATSQLYREYRYRHWLYILAAAIFYVVSFFGGWIIIRQALSPIRRISNQVQNITSSNLTERIDIAAYSHEFLPLSHALNSTFQQIHQNFELQKKFTEDASHELKTPVTVILTQTEYSLEKARDTPHYIDALHVCQRNALVLKGLIEQLLYVAKLAKTDIQESSDHVSLAMVIQQVIAELTPLASQKSLTITQQLSECTLYAPPNLIHSLVNNLVSNAIRYNRPDGAIHITCTHIQDALRLEVADSGIGIAPDELDKIFQRFYRTDKSRSQETGGTGLGLAIVKEICDLLDASITVRSQLGKGTSFAVSLPTIPARTPLSMSHK